VIAQRILRIVGLLAFAGTIALGMSTVASAANPVVDGGHFLYEAQAGESNSVGGLTYDPQTQKWSIGAHPAFDDPGPGCTVDSFLSIAYCPASATPLSASIYLGDGDDHYTQTEGATITDQKTGLTTTVLKEEPFSLMVDAGPGNDDFWADADGSPTTLDGGPGDDHFTFFTPDFTGFTQTPDRPITPPDTYQILGGPGNDTTDFPPGTANPPVGKYGVTADGGPGADWIRGTTGPDVLRGGDGNDQLNGGSGNNVLDGGDGNDALFGGEGTEIEIGGPGDDSIGGGMAGGNQIDAGPGNDVIVTAAEGRDLIDCGDGLDSVYPNLESDELSLDCELIGPADEGNCAAGLTCTDIVKLEATTPGSQAMARRHTARRPLLGRTRIRFQDKLKKRIPLPLSSYGRSYIDQQGQVRVLRTTQVIHPGKLRHGAPRVTTKRISFILKGS
jgi:Ca2+-binding RTX toxin-like protein